LATPDFRFGALSNARDCHNFLRRSGRHQRAGSRHAAATDDRRATIIGTVLRARSTDEKAKALRRFAAAVLPLVSCGFVRPVIDRVYPVGEIRAAHEQLESNRTFGKIVLSLS